MSVLPCRYTGCTNQVVDDQHPCEYCEHHCPDGSFFRDLRQLFVHLRGLLDGYPTDTWGGEK